MVDPITHWIGGQPWSGAADRAGEIYDPATGRITGRVVFASAEVVDLAVTAAADAFGHWRRTSVAKRVQVLFKFHELLSARRDELASIIVAEHGKVHSDALGEIARGIEVLEYACGIPHLVRGGFTEQASTDIDIHSVRQPLGPIAII